MAAQAVIDEYPRTALYRNRVVRVNVGAIEFGFAPCGRNDQRHEQAYDKS